MATSAASASRSSATSSRATTATAGEVERHQRGEPHHRRAGSRSPRSPPIRVTRGRAPGPRAPRPASPTVALPGVSGQRARRLRRGPAVRSLRCSVSLRRPALRVGYASRWRREPRGHAGALAATRAGYSSSSSSIRRSARRRPFGSAPDRRSASAASSASATGSATGCSGSAAARCGPLRSTAFVVPSTRRSTRDSTIGASWSALSAGFDSRRLHFLLIIQLVGQLAQPAASAVVADLAARFDLAPAAVVAMSVEPAPAVAVRPRPQVEAALHRRRWSCGSRCGPTSAWC